MAYRLEPDEDVGKGLWRIAREELDSAADLLLTTEPAGRDFAIHEARRCVKRVRSLLRLIRPELGPRFARENVRLRDAALLLSELRDCAALIETLDGLRRKCAQSAPHDTFRRARAGLMRRKREIEGRHDAPAVMSAVAALLQRNGRPWHIASAGFDAVAPGLETTWRNGRRALARVCREPAAENFHELRKRVKERRLQAKLLAAMLPGAAAVAEKKLRRLDSWLGDDHNLWLLASAIGAAPERWGKPEDAASILALIRERQRELRERSLALAAESYAVKPKALTRELRAQWDREH